MRRLVVIFAIAATLGSAGIGRAEGELALCGGTMPSTKSCAKDFSLTGPTSMTLRLTPGVGYTGSLMARIIKGNVTVATAAAYYVAGQATPLAGNMQTEYVTPALDAGSYRLFVEASKLIKVCVPGNMCTPREVTNQGDTTAAGEYSAEVWATDSVA